MNTFKISYIFLFFLLYNDVCGHGNKCFDCTGYISNCKPAKNLVFIKNKTADEGKVQPIGNTRPDETLDECIDPKMKITDTLSNAVCFRAKDKTCGIVGPSIIVYRSLICFECELACNCDIDSGGTRGQGIFLGVFAILSFVSILRNPIQIYRPFINRL